MSTTSIKTPAHDLASAVLETLVAEGLVADIDAMRVRCYHNMRILLRDRKYLRSQTALTSWMTVNIRKAQAAKVYTPSTEAAQAASVNPAFVPHATGCDCAPCVDGRAEDVRDAADIARVNADLARIAEEKRLAKNAQARARRAAKKVHGL